MNSEFRYRFTRRMFSRRFDNFMYACTNQSCQIYYYSAGECFHGDLTTLCMHVLIKVVKSIITPPKNVYTSESRKSTGDSDVGKKANPEGVTLL